MDSEKTVLLIDDDAIVHTLVSIMLRPYQITVKREETAESALKNLENQVPDVILLDIGLPGIYDGLHFLKAIRNNPIFRTLPVIVLTGKGDKTSIVKSLQAGANGYVIKPFTQNVLLDELKKIIAVQRKTNDSGPSKKDNNAANNQRHK